MFRDNNNKVRKSLIIIYSASLIVLLGILTYAIMSLYFAKPEMELAAATPVPTTGPAHETETVEASLSGDETLVTIGPDTLIVYEYYYTGDGSAERTQEFPPYFLLNKPREYFEQTFIDWEILEFGVDEVLLRKNVEGKSTQYYVIGIHEGFVAVFYEEETNGSYLKEITDTPVKTLAADEQETLKNGIHIFGNDALIKALEDFGS